MLSTKGSSENVAFETVLPLCPRQESHSATKYQRLLALSRKHLNRCTSQCTFLVVLVAHQSAWPIDHKSADRSSIDHASKLTRVTFACRIHQQVPGCLSTHDVLNTLRNGTTGFAP